MSNLSKAGLELLVESAKALLEETTLDELLKRILDKAIEVSGAERGYILLRDLTDELKPSISRGIEPDSIPVGDPSTSVIERALQERKPVISRNALRDPRFSGSSSLILRGIHSTCCIPLFAHNENLGALYLDAKGLGKLTDSDLPLLEVFGSLAGLALGRILELDKKQRSIEVKIEQTRFPGIIGESLTMRRMFEKMERIATADLPVLIVGESGTGKELIARAIHSISRRSKEPLRAIFCGNLTPELLESELFGYKRGAFTGAIADKPGLLDLANRGTLFLDEIADVPLQIQAKLLRFLQDGEYLRLGDPNPKYADVRIISATNRDLTNEIAANRFREDLFYRLNVLRIEVPPLREREGDIDLLAIFILNKIANRTGQTPRRPSRAALNKLNRYHWPGNVRELENVLARAAVLSASEIIEPEDIDLPETESIDFTKGTNVLKLDEAIKNHILSVLRSLGGNRSEAARVLGVSRRYLQKCLAKWRDE